MVHAMRRYGWVLLPIAVLLFAWPSLAAATVQVDPTVEWSEPTCEKPVVIATVSVPEDGQEDTFALYDAGDPVQGETVTVSPGSSGKLDFPVTPGGDGFALTVRDGEGSQVGSAFNGRMPACDPPPCDKECVHDPNVRIIPCCVQGGTVLTVRVDNPNKMTRTYKIAILKGDDIVGGPVTSELKKGTNKEFDFGPFADGTYVVKVWDLGLDEEVYSKKVTTKCASPSPSHSPSASPSGSPSPSASPSTSVSPSHTPAPGGGGGQTPPGSLPTTGGKLLPIVGVGLVLIVGGAALLLLARRRRESVVEA